jgi:hypothetical protein
VTTDPEVTVTATEPSPAELLTAAADHLEKLLVGVSAGPWNDDGPYWHCAGNGDDEATALVTTPGRKPVLLAVPTWARNSPNPQRAHANVRYAAAMNPAVGRALALWLRAEAGGCGALERVPELLTDIGERISGERQDYELQVSYSTLPQAVALARAVLASRDGAQ